jgi:hypothetical protein
MTDSYECYIPAAGAESDSGWAAQSTYIYVEYRAVSGVFQNIDPPPSEGVLPPHHRRGGGYTLAGRWGVNILEDARHWTGLLQYNLSTLSSLCYSRRYNTPFSRFLSCPTANAPLLPLSRAKCDWSGTLFFGFYGQTILLLGISYRHFGKQTTQAFIYSVYRHLPFL